MQTRSFPGRANFGVFKSDFEVLDVFLVKDE